MIGPTSVMISCVQRRDTERAITLRNLAAAGIAPLVHESTCDPAGPNLNRHVAYRAVSSAAGNPLGCMFWEDDVTIKPDAFQRFLGMAVELGQMVTFTSFRPSLHPAGLLDRARAAGRWPAELLELTRKQTLNGYYGSQAVYLPAWLVRRVMDARADFVLPNGDPMPANGDGFAGHGFDFWLRDHAPKIYVAFPNPVQHRNPPKMKFVTRGLPVPAAMQQRHQSLSFGIEPIFYDE